MPCINKLFIVFDLLEKFSGINFDDVKVGKSWDGEEAKQQRIVDSDDFYMAQDVSIAFTYGCFTDKE